MVSYAGCDGPAGNSGNVNAEPEAPDPDNTAPSPATVLVQFRNLGSTAVDAQFYTTNGELTRLPDDLFTPAHLLQAGIGVGGTGILEPLSVDELHLQCTEGLVLGTLGGEFLDADLGTVLGQGSPRFLQAGYQFDCGATLVLEYSQTLGGYAVNLFLEN